MSEFVRQIGAYQGTFSYQGCSLVLNLNSKSIILFARITDSNMPQPLKQIAENAADLYEFMKDITDDKIAVNQRCELILSIMMGRKIKQYTISLQKAQISSEQKDKKRIVQLQRLLQQKDFQLNFYKTEYHLLLKNIQLKPNIEELSNHYMRDVSDLAFENQSRIMKKTNSSYFVQQKSQVDRLTMSSISSKVQKVGKLQQNIPFRCPNDHTLTHSKTEHQYFKCNICQNHIQSGTNRYNCKGCDFDACQSCCKIPPQNRKYCPKQHALKLASSKLNFPSRKCDKCSKTGTRQLFSSCIECDYDLCPNCSK